MRRVRVLTRIFPASSIVGSSSLQRKGKPMKNKEGKRNLRIGAVFVSILVALGACQALLENRAGAPGPTVQAPMFEVDPLWPKPLPNHWLLGWTIGVWVDEQDHVWVIHRGAGGLHANEKGLELNPPISECCRTAPPILEFDQAGNLLRHWGGPGPGYEWPEGAHGIHIDYKGNVWLGGNGKGDAHVLKFTKDGKFLMQLGRYGKNAGSNNLENFGRVAKIWVDPKTNEAYIADGYTNKRVAVVDADTGKMKRYWGADGNFVKEAFYAKETLASGSAWDITFSKDREQRFMFLADGQNEKVRVILRETLEELTNFGDGGRQPGQFYGVHSIATDSRGNLYTTETYEGKRVQKFVYKGIGTVPRGSQGVPWPR